MTKKKIEKLTSEQEKHLVEFRAKWLNVGLCCEPANFDRAEEQITFLYEKLGKKKPMFFRFSSPLTAELGCHALEYIMKNKDKFFGANLRDNLWANLGDNLRDNLRDNLWANLWANLGDNLWANLGDNLWANLGDNLWANLGDNLGDKRYFSDALCYWGTAGQFDVPWVAFYKFGEDLGIKYKDSDLALLNTWGVLSESCCAWVPYENICIISDRPSFIAKDDAGRLHSETLMSVEFRDGYGLYMWHGIEIPKDWVEDRKSLTPEIALTWKNVEQRRAACELLGWSNVLEHPSLKPKIIDKDEPHIGTLVQVDLPDAPEQWFLKYQCGTGRWFSECVNDKTFDTALKANAGGNGWRHKGNPEDYIPFMRT